MRNLLSLSGFKAEQIAKIELVEKKLEWLKNQDPRILFTTIYVSGFLLLIFLSTLNVGSFLFTLISMLPMFVYVLFGILNRNSENIESIADSIYFLGFIFTLTCISFLLFSVNLNDPGKGFNEIVKIFGFALLTTILGLLSKILLVNFSPTFSSITQYTENELSQTVHKFDQQLHESINRFQIMDTRMAELFEVKFEKTTENLDVAISQASVKLTGFLEESNKHLLGTIDELNEKIKIPENIFVEKLKDPIEKMSSLISKYNLELETSIDSQAIIKKESQKISRALPKVKNVFNDLETELSTFMSSLKELGFAFTGQITEIDKTFSTYEDLMKRLVTMEDMLSKIFDDNKEKMEISGKLNSELKKEMEFIVTYKNDIEEALKKSEKGLEQMYKDLISAAQFVNEKLN